LGEFIEFIAAVSRSDLWGPLHCSGNGDLDQSDDDEPAIVIQAVA